jgi:hypothetical protein
MLQSRFPLSMFLLCSLGRIAEVTDLKRGRAYEFKAKSHHQYACAVSEPGVARSVAH